MVAFSDRVRRWRSAALPARKIGLAFRKERGGYWNSLFFQKKVEIPQIADQFLVFGDFDYLAGRDQAFLRQLDDGFFRLKVPFRDKTIASSLNNLF